MPAPPLHRRATCGPTSPRRRRAHGGPSGATSTTRLGSARTASRTTAARGAERCTSRQEHDPEKWPPRLIPGAQHRPAASAERRRSTRLPRRRRRPAERRARATPSCRKVAAPPRSRRSKAHTACRIRRRGSRRPPREWSTAAAIRSTTESRPSNCATRVLLARRQGSAFGTSAPASAQRPAPSNGWDATASHRRESRPMQDRRTHPDAPPRTAEAVAGRYREMIKVSAAGRWHARRGRRSRCLPDGSDGGFIHRRP